MNLIDLSFTPIQYYLIVLLILFLIYRWIFKPKLTDRTNKIVLIFFYPLVLAVPSFFFYSQGNIVALIVLGLASLLIVKFLIDNLKIRE